MTLRPRWKPHAGLLALALVASAPLCAAAAELPVRVVSSIPPLAMLVSELGGDRVLVHSVLPPGADPHTFEPRPSDAKAVADADVVVMLGSAVDEWIANALDATRAAVVVRLDDGAGQGDGDGRQHEHGGHGAEDPHVWLDPLWVRDRAVPALHRALATADPAGAARYGVAARAMTERLTELDEDIRAAFARASTHSFLSWHPAWARFASRYGLHSAGSVGESDAREPSLGVMIAAVRSGKAAGVRGVLVEPQTDPRQAAVLADEIGVPCVTVDPLGDAWSLDRANYRDLMMFNAAAFARALGAVSEEEDDDDAGRRDADDAAPISRLRTSRSSP